MESLKRPGVWDVLLVVAAPVIFWFVTHSLLFTVGASVAFALGSADAYRRRRRRERQQLDRQQPDRQQQA